jgi:hypothetical protein
MASQVKYKTPLKGSDPTLMTLKHFLFKAIALFVACFIVAFAAAYLFVAATAGGATPSATTTIPLSPPITVSPPSTINNTCAINSSYKLNQWFRTLPDSAIQPVIVLIPASYCYLVNTGIKLLTARNLSIDGGTFKDLTVPTSNSGAQTYPSIMWFVGGSGIRLSNLNIIGANPGGYHPPGAFMGAIRSDGVAGLWVTNVNITAPFGDGVNLEPLRTPNDIGSDIVGPTRGATLTDITITGNGRQAIAMGDLAGGTFTNLKIKHSGIDAFDMEADQYNEGVSDLAVTGCSIRGVGGIAFGNGGLGAGAYTHDVSFSYCNMENYRIGGTAIYIHNNVNSVTARGPFVFDHDTIWCGHSIYVACISLSDATASVTNSSLNTAPRKIDAERTYTAEHGTILNLGSVTYVGAFKAGYKDKTSIVTNTTPVPSAAKPVVVAP